jgi:hypothetical protein
MFSPVLLRPFASHNESQARGANNASRVAKIAMTSNESANENAEARNVAASDAE